MPEQHCAHEGSWHAQTTQCSLKCALRLGLSDLGKQHWSCCFETDSTVRSCRGSQSGSESGRCCDCTVRSCRGTESERSRFVLKTGHCRKEGGFVKSWRRRFFLLDDQSLRYYVPSKFCQPQWQTEPLAGYAELKGTIQLHSITAVMPVGDELHVATKGGRTYKLCPAPCAEDPSPIGNTVECWAAALQQNIAWYMFCAKLNP